MSREGSRPRRFFIIGNPGSPRVEVFNAALGRQGYPAAVLIPWLDWIEGRCDLSNLIRRGDVVRIESSGRYFPTERPILASGVELAEQEGCSTLSRAQIAAMEIEKGRIVCPRQWYLGFRRLLNRLGNELNALDGIVQMNASDEIAMMFDKPACHGAMTTAGIAVPSSLGQPSCYNDLIDRMIKASCLRVFVKLAHGSGGSGIVAYQTAGRRHFAWTTVETVDSAQGLALYNTRKLRRLTNQGDISRLIDAHCQHRVHVERWIPKAGMEGMTFDLRVVVINDAPAHSVARLSQTPVTNLHLLNHRRPGALVRLRTGEQAWDRAMQTCAAAKRLFPRSLYAGVDLLITPDFRHHAVLEINAFGDQLPGVLHQGLDPYEAEIQAVVAGHPAEEAVA
jgi:glutathione synthase/RimK-type ligase-like ATP-grasp enzyme